MTRQIDHIDVANIILHKHLNQLGPTKSKGQRTQVVCLEDASFVHARIIPHKQSQALPLATPQSRMLADQEDASFVHASARMLLASIIPHHDTSAYSLACHPAGPLA